jgi:hypothetical protein
VRATGRRPDHRKPDPQATLWDWQTDPGRSARDIRRTWTRLLPRIPGFTNPAAIELAAWSDAILFHETWAAWCAAHPEGGGL